MASRPSGKMLKSLPPDPARHQDSAITLVALDVTIVFQTIAERSHEPREWAGRRAVKKPNHRYRRLLRLRHEWPSGDRATDKRDELAPSHVSPRIRRRHLSGSNEYFDRG